MRRLVLPLVLVLTISLSSVTDAAPLAPAARPSTSVAPGSALNLYAKVIFAAALSPSRSPQSLYFPIGPFVTLKESDASAYYHSDLLPGFALDLAALHQLLVSYHSAPVFLYASDRADALTWIAPGACGNRLGYWHLPGLRLVYRSGSRVYSVAVLSMISWRARLYVIHLGAFSHPTGRGVVANPSSGPGYPWGPGGC